MSVGMAVGSQALSIAADLAVRSKLELTNRFGRAIRAGPGIDREGEGRVADEVALANPASCWSGRRVEAVAQVVGRA